MGKLSPLGPLQENRKIWWTVLWTIFLSQTQTKFWNHFIQRNLRDPAVWPPSCTCSQPEGKRKNAQRLFAWSHTVSFPLISSHVKVDRMGNISVPGTCVRWTFAFYQITAASRCTVYELLKHAQLGGNGRTQSECGPRGRWLHEVPLGAPAILTFKLTSKLNGMCLFTLFCVFLLKLCIS